ncbi:hypothetical protein [Tenacibaculum soleae]|uniref:hypothetical protein n=1 Tax=Tenacibaculum soleae TaxID=447689 RepID=UPI002300FFD9|nr:hypothetical protein [Tenacibaculum soleae]
MDVNKRSLCSTCIDVDFCNLTSNNIFIWSCNEFNQEKRPNNNTVTLDVEDLKTIKRKKELELI